MYRIQYHNSKSRKKHCHHTHTHTYEFARHISYLAIHPPTRWPFRPFEKISNDIYRPRTNFRVWPGSRLDKMAPRNPCWRRYTPFLRGLAVPPIPPAGRALACTWTRKSVACVCVCV